MSSHDNDNNRESNSIDTYVFTNIDKEAISCDINPAHFDGLVADMGQIGPRRT